MSIKKWKMNILYIFDGEVGMGSDFRLDEDHGREAQCHSGTLGIGIG